MTFRKAYFRNEQDLFDVRRHVGHESATYPTRVVVTE